MKKKGFFAHCLQNKKLFDILLKGVQTQKIKKKK